MCWQTSKEMETQTRVPDSARDGLGHLTLGGEGRLCSGRIQVTDFICDLKWLVFPLQHAHDGLAESLPCSND